MMLAMNENTSARFNSRNTEGAPIGRVIVAACRKDWPLIFSTVFFEGQCCRLPEPFSRPVYLTLHPAPAA